MTRPGRGASLPRAGSIRHAVARAGGEAVALAWTVSERLADAVIGVIHRGRAFLARRSAVRTRALERRNHVPLSSLWQIHPEARLARARELGLRSVPLADIAGTAVAGPAQRGGDFLPLQRFRSGNWRGRWQRIRRAVDRLEVLPPVDLLKYADRYWVTDGHNRVAAALYAGQLEIDAVVTALVAPGSPLADTPASLAELSADSQALRAAGSGRWTPAVDRRQIDEAGLVFDRPARSTTLPRDP
jgi:hypothetical protein